MLGIKCSKIFPLLVMNSHCQKKFPLLEEVPTARVILPLGPDEHQLRFSKYKTARELWAAILKTFGGNEATKKMKKNLLKQQYGNFRAEGSKTLEQTLSDHDLYNHLKVYESEVQKKTKPNSLNMAFISLAKHSSGNKDGNTACVPTASTNIPTASASIATICQDTTYTYIASQSSGSQIKFEDINQIDEDNIEEMDIKWNMALLSMRADKEDHALVANEEAPTEFALMANTSTESKDLSWTGLPECKDDTVTNYSRPEPTVESSPNDDKKRNPSVSETVLSPTIPKPFVKFVKASNSQSKSKTDKTETPKKSPVKYAEQYRKTNKKPNVRGNQRNWNNLKSL
nr:hypothetical protein [Tanacetum cinerariifolium]